jgi:hypothetical protein
MKNVFKEYTMKLEKVEKGILNFKILTNFGKSPYPVKNETIPDKFVNHKKRFDINLNYHQYKYKKYETWDWDNIDIDPKKIAAIIKNHDKNFIFGTSTAVIKFL